MERRELPLDIDGRVSIGELKLLTTSGVNHVSEHTKGKSATPMDTQHKA